MTETQSEAQRHHIRQRTSVPLATLKLVGEVRWEPKFFWAIPTGLFAIGGAAATWILTESLRLTLLLPVVLGLLYYFIVFTETVEGGHTSLFVKGGRLAAFQADRLRGRNVTVSDRPLHGEIVLGERPAAKRLPVKPGFLEPLRIEEFERDGVAFGIGHDKAQGTFSGSLNLYFSSLLSSDSRLRNGILAGVANLLDRGAEVGHEVHRLAFTVHTTVGEHRDPDEHLQRLAGHTGGRLAPESELAPLRQELRQHWAQAVNHDASLTVSVKKGDVAAEAKSQGVDPREVLVQRLLGFNDLANGRFDGGISPIGLRSSEIRDWDDLVSTIRLYQDPVFTQPMLDGRTWAGLAPGQRLDEADAWCDRYGHNRFTFECGETWLAGGYLSGFPEWGITGEQFGSLLDVPVPKTITVVLQPLPFEKAAKRAKKRAGGSINVNKDRLANEQRVSAFNNLNEERAQQYEWDLATSGHKAVMCSIYVVTYGQTETEAMRNRQTIRRSHADKNFRYQPLDSLQHLAHEAILPFGRGLR